MELPESYRKRSSSCLVIDCGPGVKHGIKKGAIVLVDALFSERKHSLVPGEDEASQEDFVCKDDKIFAVFINKKIIPLGQRILVKRHMNEVYHQKVIAKVEGQPGTDQSHTATVIAFGLLPRKLRKNKKPHRWRLNVGIGDKVELGLWNEKWTEVGMDNEYYLIVEEKDLLYRHD